MRFLTGGVSYLALAWILGAPSETVSATFAFQDRCDRHDPVLVPMPGREDPDGRDEELTLDLASRVATFMRRREGVRGTMDIYVIPGHTGQLLVRTVDGEGSRFVHVSASDVELAEVWAGHGHQESTSLDPVFFNCGDRVVILAYTGDYVSWGLDAYEFEDGSMLHLGDSLEVGLASPPSPPEPGPQNPLPHASVRDERGQLIVEFDADIVLLRPGGPDELVVRSGGPVRFEYRAGEFILIRGGSRS